METIKAFVECIDEHYMIKIETEDENLYIPMSEDNSNNVKHVFNKIISRIKVGEFQIKLEEVGEDLFSQVANEYITQINREIKEVRGEMEQYGLV